METERAALVSDTVIALPGHDIPIRIYAAEDPLGVTIFFHGGGFIAGSIDSHDSMARALMRETGTTVVSVDYRLAPEHPYPAAILDARASVKWAAEAFRGQPLFLAGDSAGGLIAAVTSAQSSRTNGPSISGQVLMYPDTDLRPGANHDSWKTYDGIVLDRATKDWSLDLYLDRSVDRTCCDVSPLFARDLNTVPKTLLLLASRDPLRDEGRRYGELLASHRAEIAIHEFDGARHGFLRRNDNSIQARQAFSHVGAFIRDTALPR